MEMGRMSPYKTLVLGAGNIAQGYDTTEDDIVRTHIKAYLKYPTIFNLAAICDIDLDRAIEVAKKWGIQKVFPNLDAIEKFDFDIISVCTPDHTHGQLLKSLVRLKPKVIVLEKPIGLSEGESSQIFRLCDEYGILLLVNYIRLFSKTFSKIKSDYLREVSNLLSINIKYHKGLDHNGSHLLNLSSFFFDFELENAKVIRQIFDYDRDDPTLSAYCTCNMAGHRFDLILQGYDEKLIDIFELDIITKEKRIIYREESGSVIYVYTKEKTYNDLDIQEFVLEKQIRIDESEYFIGLMSVIILFLKGSSSSSEVKMFHKSYLKTIKIISQLKNER